jgi:hypothetical protein
MKAIAKLKYLLFQIAGNFTGGQKSTQDHTGY